MKNPAPVWQMAYAADWRNHYHRCSACNKVCKDGEDVLMARVSNKATKVVHVACADKPFANEYDWRAALTFWGIEHLAAVGYREARAIVDTDAFFRCRSA